MELVDGVKTTGIAQKRRTVKIHLRDHKDGPIDVPLENPLYIPAFLQDIKTARAHWPYLIKVRTKSVTKNLHSF